MQTLVRNHIYGFIPQYVFIHDALNELITCGETEITSNLRAKFNHLPKQILGKGTTRFNKQFQISPVTNSSR